MLWDIFYNVTKKNVVGHFLQCDKIKCCGTFFYNVTKKNVVGRFL